ncbi:MAG: PRD domain-containing protein [Acutalibacteraceae bacterium]
MLRIMEPVYLEVSGEIVDTGERKKFQNIDRNILLPLADHIAFALTRIRSKMNITNPFANDIRLLYPRKNMRSPCREKRSFRNAAAIRSTKMR